MGLLIIVLSMLYLDIAMPTALLLVVTVAMLLNKRVESRLKSTIEEKEFKTRDIILLGRIHGNCNFRDILCFVN